MSEISGISGGAGYYTEAIASGSRITSAADDASGMAIAEKENAQVNGLNQGQRNAEDVKSMLNVADGAAGKIADHPRGRTHRPAGYIQHKRPDTVDGHIAPHIQHVRKAFDGGVIVDFIHISGRERSVYRLSGAQISVFRRMVFNNIRNHPEKYHVGGAIKLGDYNVGRSGNILTLPFYMAFLLTAF